MAECLNDCTDRCESFSHERTCNCQEYTSPSLTITKIGVALHVKFALKDGSYSHIDCDINIPTIPTCTRYDGNNRKVFNYLMRVRPVGWLEEFSKLDSINIIRDSCQIKMRMMNRDTVLPRQVGFRNMSKVLTSSSPEHYLPQRTNPTWPQTQCLCPYQNLKVLHW